MWILKIISRFPLPVLYLISDLIFVFSYRIGYRKKVVIENLKRSFPNKTENEIKMISKSFYKNLADVIVETIKAYSISKNELATRVQIVGLAEMNRLYDKGISFMALTPHLANWEWVNLSLSIQLEAEVEIIYKRLKNKRFDNFLKEIRGRFGANLIEKKKVLRELIKSKAKLKAIGSLMDQSPKFGENRYWTSFLNQNTAFYNGSEKIAKKFHYSVFAIMTKRIKRGYYQLEIIKLANDASESPDNAITGKFVRLLEKNIVENPSEWLWSHRRWKLEYPYK